MSMRSTKRSLIAIFFLLPSFSNAAPHYGATASYLLVSREISSLNGYQFMLKYDPDRFKWGSLNVYFDGGFSQFWDNSTRNYTTLNIYSAAPVVRYTFEKCGPIVPYLEVSIGLAYLNHTHLSHRNLGMHFAFQDRAGIGILIGRTEQLSIGLHAAHYSNAHLCGHNSGFTLPLIIDFGIRFN